MIISASLSFVLVLMMDTSSVHVVNAFQDMSILAKVHVRKNKASRSFRFVSALEADVSATSVSEALDWSFLFGVYIITCPNADPGSVRLNEALNLLSRANVLDELQVKAFNTDDEDRIRGCYTSHISVIRDALVEMKKSKQGPKNPFQAFFSPKEVQLSTDRRVILVLEDNLAPTGYFSQRTLIWHRSWTDPVSQ